MPFAVGENIGAYRITEQLGQGGMATVFKAYHPALDRYVAIKALHPAFLEDPNFLARFQREARLVAKLEHPNIVPIYDYAEHEGRPYLVMKFIEGETLKARLAREPISPEDTARIVDAVGLALGFAHQRSILHRDIKPSNVLISKSGEIYLADFGLARIAESAETTLTSDMIVGTPQYISPEQALGKKELDEGTDIYSLGVMLYELTVGQVPFSADTPFSVIHDHIYTPLPMPQEVNPTVSDEIQRVLLKALAKERSDRFKDVAALVNSFRTAWQSAPPPQPVPSDTLRIKMEAAAKKTAQTTQATPTPEPVGEDAGSQSKPAEAPVPISQSIKRTVSKPKRKIPWMWVAIGGAVCIGCLFGIFVLRPFIQFRRGNVPTPTRQALKQPSELPEQLWTDLDAAQRLVDENPEDPNAHVQFAIALFDAGQPERAHEQLDWVLEKSGSDEIFFWIAGQKLGEHQAWLGAARMYIRAAEIQGQVRSLEGELRNRLREAVYKSSDNPAAERYLVPEQLAGLDNVCFYISRARYEFYFGNESVAQQILDEMKVATPGAYAADLLQAHFCFRLGLKADGREIVDLLLSKETVPEWIKVEADKILNQIP